MAVTKLKRKALRRKIASKNRKTILKHLTAKPMPSKHVKPQDIG